MSQADLGQSLGISFQQIQKYELGVNRIGVGRLVEMANILEMPITYFLDDTEQEKFSFRNRLEASGQSRSKISNQCVEVATLFAEIEDPVLRKRILSLVQTIAESQG